MKRLDRTSILVLLLVTAFICFGLAPVTPAANPQTTRRQPTADDSPSSRAQRDDEITLNSELVILDVTVVDKSNRPIFDIPRDRFAILEDGVPQTIDFFSREEAPISMGLAIDTSGSMRSKLESVVQSVSNLVNTNRPSDETAVIEFKDSVELIEEFTASESDVEDALGDLIANGQTALLDAIMLASDYVQKDGRHRRKTLVVVTDGLEKDSFYSIDEVVDHMRELDVRLYLIGFTQDLNDGGGLFRKSQKDKAEQLLNRLATETGGRAFFPRDIAELSGITDQIAKDMRTVFAIGYYPTNTKKDGTYRKIDIRVMSPDNKADSKLVARTRAGYYAPKQ